MSNIIIIIIALLYCTTLQYNKAYNEFFKAKDLSGKQYFVELQNKTNIPLFDYKLKLNNIFWGNLITKTLNFTNYNIALKNILFDLIISRINNFKDIIINNYVFKDSKICFPFHYFY